MEPTVKTTHPAAGHNPNLNPDLNPDLLPDREPFDLPLPQAAPVLPGATQNAAKATHFTGPICSRQAVSGQSPVSGEAPLLLRYFLDNSNVTDFAIQFPPGSVVWRMIVNVTVAYNGTTPKFNVGSTTGGTSDLVTMTIPGPGVLDQAFPASLPASGTIYLNVTGASAAGAAQIMFLYAGRPALKWN